MTILQAVDGNRHGNLTDATARRLRGELAERNISKTWLATQLGVSKMWLTRRTSGTVPMSTEDLEAIEQVTGISYVYLVTGIKPNNGGDGSGGAWPATGAGPKPPITTGKRERTYAAVSYLTGAPAEKAAA